MEFQHRTRQSVSTWDRLKLTIWIMVLNVAGAAKPPGRKTGEEKGETLSKITRKSWYGREAAHCERENIAYFLFKQFVDSPHWPRIEASSCRAICPHNYFSLLCGPECDSSIIFNAALCGKGGGRGK